MNEIKITGFYITSHGDYSVGIFDQTWKIDGDFFFNDKEELEQFRKQIKQSFELIAENISVETFEEIEEIIKIENELFKLNELNYYEESSEI